VGDVDGGEREEAGVSGRRESTFFKLGPRFFSELTDSLIQLHGASAVKFLLCCSISIMDFGLIQRLDLGDSGDLLCSHSSCFGRRP
jgi:hypothetical protein